MLLTNTSARANVPLPSRAAQLKKSTARVRRAPGREAQGASGRPVAPGARWFGRGVSERRAPAGAAEKGSGGQLELRQYPRLGSARLGSARLGSARLGSARLGSARLGSARLLIILSPEGRRLLNTAPYRGPTGEGARRPPEPRRSLAAPPTTAPRTATGTSRLGLVPDLPNPRQDRIAISRLPLRIPVAPASGPPFGSVPGRGATLVASRSLIKRNI